jgi:hypothetical protein
MHENSQWKAVYYDALASRSIPLGTILLVMAAHYACCVDSHVETPFHGLKNKFDSCSNTSLPENVTHVKLSIPDPISFIYASCMTLTRNASGVLNASSVPNATSNVSSVDDRSGLIQVCVMHAISLGAFLALLLPTTYTNFSTKSAALWTIGSISVCCSFASWSLCMFVYTFGMLRKLSLCLSIHLTMQLLGAQGFLADKDPSVPIYMPLWVARGVNVAQGLYCIPLPACL